MFRISSGSRLHISVAMMDVEAGENAFIASSYDLIFNVRPVPSYAEFVRFLTLVVAHLAPQGVIDLSQ